MGLKEFNADLAAAKGLAFSGVSSIRKGDTEGELTFIYNHDRLKQAIRIQVLAQDIDSYPKHPCFMIFVSSDDIDSDITEFLTSLSDYAERKPIEKTISLIADKLDAKLMGCIPMDQDLSEIDASDYGESDGDYTDYDDDHDGFGISAETLTDPSHPCSPTISPSHIDLLKKDLFVAKKHGFSIGALEATSSELGNVFSLSVEVRQLGVADEVLEARDLDPSGYLVLLLKYHRGYPTAQEYLKTSRHAPSIINFEVGKCARAMPSTISARQAFKGLSDRGEEGEKDDAEFRPLYLFSSVRRALEKDFATLLGIRRKLGKSWEETQVDFYTGAFSIHSTSPTARNQKASQTKTDTPGSGPWILRQDNALDEENDLSIPLVAMQFVLQRLVNCGRYCINCYTKTEAAETMRPYVCSKPLCLDQYFYLNFGSGIEHEIVNNPYVVDLLVSFFYSALYSSKLRDFPTGLGLKIPGPEISQSYHGQIEARVLFKERKGVLRVSDNLVTGMRRPLQEGERVLAVRKNSRFDPTQSIWDQTNAERYLCRILSCEYETFSFELLACWPLSPLGNVHGPSLGDTKAHNMDYIGDHEAYIYQYNDDLDTISDPKQLIQPLWTLTCGIPSILQIRKFIIENPGHSLSGNNPVIDKTTFKLLNWVVNSNRSFIVQDEEVKPSPPPPDPDLLWATPESAARNHQPTSESHTQANKVLNMGSEWMQFRFVQGSPEKEHQFSEELKLVKKHVQDDRRPTFFAWHGSSIGNWYGIVSNGLNFDKRDNGRSFGNGVYLSDNFTVSQGYMRDLARLNISGAISMCEIINRPEDFVSRQPHYVVNKIHWIQCRYLFVRVSPTEAALKEPFPSPSIRASQGYLRQDPSRILHGPLSKPVSIPLSALPVSRRQNVTGAASGGVDDPSSASTQRFQDGPFEGDDLSGILDEMADGSIPQEEALMLPSGFRPGSLDWDTLPKIGGTDTASHTAALALGRQMKEMKKIQDSSDLSSLGWYIDFDKMTNMTSWIVELHSFEDDLLLTRDMNKLGCTSIVLELRFGDNYPMSPPFVRVVRPRFLPLMQGGGGHVTSGGAICSELLTNSGWSPALSLEKVIIQVRLGICDRDPPARLDLTNGNYSYGLGEALQAYMRAAQAHGWGIPDDFRKMASPRKY